MKVSVELDIQINYPPVVSHSTRAKKKKEMEED